MISVTEAKKIIKECNIIPKIVKLPLQEVAGMVLAEDVYAATDIPLYPQSSMDGYAFSYSGWQQHGPLKINGEIPAGSKEVFTLDDRHAIRIFTGAAVPEGADTVVMQEKTNTENDKLFIKDSNIQPGNNVRPKGSEITAGSIALKKESYLSPAAVGFLAGIGVTNVMVYPAPSVSLIITGKELQSPGKPLAYGQVYESNSYSLRAALQQADIKNIEVVQADDDLEILQKLLEQALQKSDVVLLTGGVSVGDYDFVVEATKRCGVAQKFHKVAQRPGKPLYFGMKDLKPVFGLPGNPSSVLSCFYNYVLIALESLSKKKKSLQKVAASLTTSYPKQKGLTHFLKGHFKDGCVTPLGAQESFRLSSFAQANCLICLEERADYEAGETVEVYLLPGIN